MEFGMFHEFQRRAGADRGGGLHRVVRAGGRGRTLRPRRDVAGRTAHRAGALGAGLAADDRHRDRRAHQADEDRHRRAGAAAVPSAAAGRGGGDRRSHQPRPADLRRRPQRLSAGLSGLRRVLRGKPRALRRGAGDPQARLDAGALQLRRQVLPFPRCLPGAEAVPEAVSGDPRRGDQSRHLSGATARWAIRSSAPRGSAICRSWARTCGVSRGVDRRRPSRQRQGLPARAGLCRADRGARPRRSRKRA